MIESNSLFAMLVNTSQYINIESINYLYAYPVLPILTVSVIAFFSTSFVDYLIISYLHPNDLLRILMNLILFSLFYVSISFFGKLKPLTEMRRVLLNMSKSL